MTIKKETYTEFDKGIYGDTVTVITTYYSIKNEIEAIIGHVQFKGDSEYKISVYKDGIIQKIFGTNSSDFVPKSSYEIVYNYSKNKCEILHFNTKVISKNWSTVFIDLINLVYESESNPKHRLLLEHSHLLRKKTKLSDTEKELHKIELKNFDEKGNIINWISNEIKEPQNFKQEEYKYDKYNELFEIQYRKVKDSDLHLHAIDIITYPETTDFSLKLTTKWKSLKDRFYVSAFHERKIWRNNYDGDPFVTKEYREVKVNEYVNDSYGHKDLNNYGESKLLCTYEEVVKYEEDIEIYPLYDTIRRTTLFESEIDSEEVISIYRNIKTVKSKKQYTHCYDKANLYFEGFDYYEERKSSVLCFDGEGSMFSSRFFEYY